jgi:hypothetical protein
MTNNTNALIAKALTDAKVAARKFKAADENVTTASVAAAHATHSAITVGLIVSRKDAKDAPKGCLSRTEYAALFAVSGSRVTQWANAGKAFSLGVKDDSREGRSLAAGKASHGHVSAAINAPGATAKSILSALMEVENGNAPKSPAKPKVKGTDEEKGEKVEGVRLGRNNTERAASVETILAGWDVSKQGSDKLLQNLLERVTVLIAATDAHKVAPKPTAPKSRTNKAA